LAAQAVHAELESAVLSAEASVQAARVGLARWLGEAAAMQPLADAPDFTTLPSSPAQLLAGAGAHAELMAWDARERAAAAAVDAARARKRPQFAVGASYGARSAGLPDMAMLEVSVALPLFPRQRQDRDIAARRAEREAVAAEREEATRAHRETVQRQLAVWEGLRAERERLHARVLPLARDRRTVALAAYANGDPIQPWLDARRDELALLRRAVQTDAALARAWLQLTTLTARTQGATP
jgi:cobalt-zinc-cadmium efflux system outer membrane protein